jgi:hypothetical protein
VTGIFLQTLLVGVDYGGAVQHDVFHERVGQDANHDEGGVRDLVKEEEEYGEDQDDITVWQREVCETLDGGPNYEPCWQSELISDDLTIPCQKLLCYVNLNDIQRAARLNF